VYHTTYLLAGEAEFAGDLARPPPLGMKGEYSRADFGRQQGDPAVADWGGGVHADEQQRQQPFTAANQPRRDYSPN